MADAHTPSAIAKRTAARLYAVQALYALAQSDQTVSQVLGDFVLNRLGKEVDGDQYIDPDRALFQRIVKGVAARQADLDPLIDGGLSGGWSVERLELLLTLVLRAAVWELLEQPDTAAKIIIADYVHLGDAFFSGREPAMINAVLDSVARTLRPDEMAAAPVGRG
jgi:N utilization substance protein B